MRADACFKLLGKYISYIAAKEERVGRLVQIRIDPGERMLIGIDENGFIEEYELNDINVIANKSGQKNLARQIIKQVNKDINSFQFDLGEYRKNEIIGILQKPECENARNGIIRGFDTGDRLESCAGIYRLIRNQDLSEEEKDILCGSIAYKQRDYGEAYRIFSSRWLKNKMDSDTCRDFILVADEFDNDALCFFLLKHFFRINSRYINDKYYVNLWWKYLYYAVKYNNFDFLLEIPITEWNVRVLIDSFIYIFHMYNLEHLAVGLTNQFSDGNNTILQRNNEDLGDIDNAVDELNLCKNYLPATAEGYYLRFESCMERLLEAYASGKVDCSGDEKAGYIYEYVKSRNYGFIIGFDFQKYFYHWDDITTNLKKRIMDNIYSDKEVTEEDKIHVQFRCESVNKKNQAMDII